MTRCLTTRRSITHRLPNRPPIADQPREDEVLIVNHDRVERQGELSHHRHDAAVAAAFVFRAFGFVPAADRRLLHEPQRGKV